MFPQRRIRSLLIAILTLTIIFLYYSGDGPKIQDQKFYRSTVQAIEAQRHAVNEAASVKVQPEQPKPVIPEAPKPQVPKMEAAVKPNDDDEETQDISIAGRTKMTVLKNKDNAAPKQEPAPEVDAHAEAKDELNGILKRSPIIVFSKSYCPFSAKAKSILLERYAIVPAPYVVELDHHRLGKELQTVLGESTGRRTVPNILVNGKSIGGGDDVSALDDKDELTSTLKNLGGKWIQDVTRHERSHHE